MCGACVGICQINSVLNYRDSFLVCVHQRGVFWPHFAIIGRYLSYLGLNVNNSGRSLSSLAMSAALVEKSPIILTFDIVLSISSASFTWFRTDIREFITFDTSILKCRHWTTLKIPLLTKSSFLHVVHSTGWSIYAPVLLFSSEWWLLNVTMSFLRVLLCIHVG